MFIYLSMSTTFGSKDIVIRKPEFVAKTQFLYRRKERTLNSCSLEAVEIIFANSNLCLNQKTSYPVHYPRIPRTIFETREISSREFNSFLLCSI